jgi:serine/threonine protein kinase
MEDQDPTLMLPKNATPPQAGVTDSQMQNLLAVGAGAFDTQLTSPSRGWEPPSVEMLQALLPQYEITALIARGGMGAVYKGQQRTLKRPVAIKVLPPEMEDGDLQFVERFKHEAQAMARLSHPNIVAVFDAGEVQVGRVVPHASFTESASGERRLEDQQPNPSSTLLYFVMEFIEGTDVAQLIASEGRVEPLRAIQIITAVCEALAFAHEEGIIHRDIKPSNIMLDRRGRVKVADFGLAKTVNVESTLMTRSNVAMGTPDFIAPEALMPGMVVDGRADIYAVGVMLYQMLTGTIPRGRFELPSGVVPQVNRGFDAIVDRAMQTDRDRRYSTATEMKTAVEQVSQGSAKDGSADSLRGSAAPVRHNPSGGEAANKKEAGKSARAPLLLGTAIAVILGTAALFLMDEPKEAEGRADGPPAVSASPSLPVSSSSATALEARAIKLWDSAAKLPKASGVRWEDGAMYLDQANGTAGPESRNAILRASIRKHPKVGGLIFALRAVESPHAQARLTVDFGRGKAFLSTSTGGMAIGQWPLPRAYGADEWVRVELRAIGNDFTVLVEGQVIGTAHSEALSRPGKALISSSLNGYFRDIVYIPLDDLSEAEARKVVGVDASVKAAQPQWRQEEFTTESLGNRPGVTLEAGVLHITQYEGWQPPAVTVNSAIRATVLWSKPNSSKPTNGHADRRIVMRSQAGVSNYYYVCLYASTVAIAALDQKRTTDLKTFKLDKPPQDGEEVVVQFACVGRRLAVWVRGEYIGSVEDDSISKAGKAGMQANDGFFKNVETMNLDGLSEAEALKALGIADVSASPSLQVPGAASTFPPGQWVNPFADLSKLPGLAEFKDGWARLGGNNGYTPLGELDGKSPAFRSAGIRLRRTDASGLYGPQLALRYANGRYISLQYYPPGGTRQSAAVQLREYHPELVTKGASAAQCWAANLLLAEKEIPAIGMEYTTELTAVGSTVVGRINDVTVTCVVDDGGKSGQLAIAGAFRTPFRDVEVINLDGLSEAEARQAAGIAPASASPSPQVSASPQFPPGQWVKLFTKAEDLPEELRKPDSGVRFEDGWIRFGVKPVRYIYLPAELQKNYAIRCRFKRDPATGHSAGLVLRSGTDGGGQPGFYSFDLSPKQELLIKRKQSGPQGDSYPTISTTKATDAELTKPEEVIEFGVVGDHLVARLGMSFVKLVIDPHLRQGKGYIAGGGASAVRDIEVINLDGLPEAEALRLLGVDEQGKDVRGKAASAAVSSSPSLPVPQSSASFPPGQWVKVFTKPEDLPVDLRSEFKVEDGWITGTSTKWLAASLEAKNRAVRARLRRQTGESETLVLGAKQSYQIRRSGSDGSLVILKCDGLVKTPLAQSPPDGGIQAGEEFTIEAGRVGNLIVARSGANQFLSTTDSSYQGTALQTYGKDSIRDIEVINLDGLPEAEALRLLGVDEQGKDVRAASKTGALGPSALPAALEARAVKLWDAPEKIPTSAKLRWEDRAVRVDGQPLREKAGVRDLILRAAVRLNPSAQIQQLHARVQSTSEGGTSDAHYSLSISGDAKSVMLIANIGGKRKDLQTWPLVRPPGPDPWLRLELKIIGDALTVSAEGQVLGTVLDTSVPAAGDVVLFADAGGYFRDISYIPLDGLSAAERK